MSNIFSERGQEIQALRNTIAAYEEALKKFKRELLDLEALDLGLKIGNGYKVTEEFHKVFPLLMDTEVTLTEIEIDDVGDRMLTFGTSKWPVTIEASMIEDYIICP